MVVRRRVKTIPKQGETVKPVTAPLPAGTVEIVEKYDSTNSISANGYDSLIDYEVPEGYVAELVGLGIIPDYDPSDGSSHALYVKVASETGEFWPPAGAKALCKHGMNWFSWGSPASKKPLFMFDQPGKRNSLTLKFNTKDTIKIHIYADDTGVSDYVYVRALIYLYDVNALKRYFGIDDLSKFATLPGGHMQGNIRKFLFIDYAINSSATEGKGKWEDVYSKEIAEYEQVTVTHIGVIGHANALYGRLFETKNEKKLPDREPYWLVNEVRNVLPFGDCDMILGPAALPANKIPTYNFTTLKFQVQDNNAAIPADSFVVQLKGVYRKVR